jgi:hypothetical protein
LLRDALAGRSGIPTAEELQRLLGEVEVALFLRSNELPEGLIDAAWYLHAVASVDHARERYSVARQRQAFLVSAHIFDLALSQEGWSASQRLSFGFGAAIGYRRGDRDPNATAIMHRLRSDILVDQPVLDHIDTLALEAGVAFLGFEARTLFTWLATWRRQLNTIARLVELDDLTTTAYGTSHLVVLGADDLLAYLTRGDQDRLNRGRDRLRTAATGAAGPGELDARWVAAHLLAFSGEAEAGSLWNPSVVPPQLPDLVRHAFSLGSPPVLTLWSPQRELLTEARSPFASDTRRMVLSVPTSGGKTLIAQLLAVAYLATGTRSVCYVAPTRSLGREVRRAMANRIRILQKETGADQPDFPTLGELLFGEEEVPAEIEVMTPERLAHLLRHDADAVLSRFGMFIFDEAQLIKETGRGFTLESVIAMLHYATRDSDHKIVLISAALGNAGAVAQWISPQDDALLHQSQWRGPRRLHAAFSTDPDWDSTRAEKVRSSAYPYRIITDLGGLIRLRLADQRTAELSVESDIGWAMVRKAKTPALRQRGLLRDPARSTPLYRIASEMITLLGHAGSVLVVTSTRADAERLARGLAEHLQEDPAFASLADFVRLQLSDDHPLVDTLRRGVGFHHAGLPIEVLEALEDAVRSDTLPYLTCTSTLTDGVNLPVRTVVIYDQNYDWQTDDAQLRGARLVNAMGRAGRAGKETEGWIVLVRPQPPSEADFRDMAPTDEDLAVTSTLITAEALESFSDIERQLRADADALFQPAAGTAANFISFVWTMLSAEETAGADPDTVDLDEIVDATLAAQQSTAARRRCRRIAATVRRAYVASDPDARRRWPRAGTSIGSARTIDGMARRIATVIRTREQQGTIGDIADPLRAIRLMATAIERLLQLPENTAGWRFRVSPRGNDIDVKPADLLLDWLTGMSLSDLAQEHLHQISDPAYRVAQMVGAVTSHFEHYLAWTVGALIELVNIGLEAADSDVRLCPELGGFIRYGVRDTRSLILMASGVRSRRLAHAVVADAPVDLAATQEDLRYWLAGMGVTQWRTRYQASASEVLDLLDFTRLRRRSLLKTLLETGAVQIELPASAAELPQWTGPLTLEPVRGEPHPAPLAVYGEDQLVASVNAADHADLANILDTGLTTNLQIDTGVDPALLRLTLAFPD